jgi:hypothetical protein
MKANKLILALCAILGLLSLFPSTAQGQNWTPQDKAAGLIPTPVQNNYQGDYPDPTPFISSNSFTDGCYIPHDPNTWTEPTFINGGSGGDSQDDGSYGPIALPFAFDLYGVSYTEMWININGNVSFDGAYWQFSPTGFPDNDFVMLAPFWGDVDLGGTGEIWFNITPTAVYVNWVDVGYYNEQTDKVNKFQLIITDTTDPVIGVGNNVGFFYEDMSWTTGSASGGSGGFGGIPATVGANAGDGVNFFQIGRFDHAGDDYDGPVGNNDGVDYLDDQCIQFYAGDDNNQPPLAQNFPPNNTIELCLGEATNFSVNFTGPEAGQEVSVSVDDNGFAGVAVESNNDGDPAEVELTITGTSIGTFTVTFTATDDFNPPAETEVSITIEVVDCYVENPDLSVQNCPAIDVILILDESGSIDEDDDEVIDGALAMANGLSGTGARLALIIFNTEAEQVNVPGFGSGYNEVTPAYVAALNTHLNNIYNPTGWTNWEDALIKAKDINDAEQADLIVIVTDGNPTAYNNNGSCSGCNSSTANACYDCNESTSLARAEVIANQLKASGAHMFGIGVADNIDASNIAAITGPDQDLGPGDQPGPDPAFAQADYTLIPFEELEECLASIAIAACCDGIEASGSVVPNTLCGDVTCNGSINLTVDFGNAPLSFSWSNGETSEDIDGLCEGSYAVTITDANGCTENFTFEVLGTPDCQMECPENTTVECGESTDPSATGEPTTSGSCGAATISYDDEEVSGCGNTKIITRTWTLSGGCSDDNTCVQTITVVDTTAPSITCPANATVECGNSTSPDATGMATGSDNCGGVTITFSDSSQPGCGNTETITRVWVATDACGNQSSCTQLITVVDTTAPSITCPADITVECNTLYDPSVTGSATASDLCGSTTVTFTDGPMSGECPTVFTRTWTATDECGNQSSCAQAISIDDTTSPEINGPDTQLYLLEWGLLDFNVIDAFLAGEISGDEIAALAPAYLPLLVEQGFFWPEAVDNCDTDPDLNLVQILIGSEDLECPLVARAIWIYTAVDNCGNQSEPFEIVCDFFDTTPPVLGNLPGDMELDCLDLIPEPANVTVTDSCDQNPSLDYDEEIDDSSCPIYIYRTWTGTDACGNSDSYTQTIVVGDDSPPVIGDVPFSINVECDEIDDLTIPVTDECGEVEITFEDVLLSGGCLGTLHRTWTATDECGNEAHVEQFILILDTTGPVIYGVGENMDMDCSETPVVPEVWAEDACGFPVTLEFEEEFEAGICPQNYTLIWTWTATDYCGNLTVETKTVTVSDTTPPTFVNPPGDLDYDCDDVIPDPVDLQAEDDCGVANVSYNEVEVPGDCPQSYSIERIWTAVDECGNSTDHIQTISISDTHAPVFTDVPGETTVECSDALPGDLATAEDDCGAVTVTFSDEIIPTDCESEYTIIRTFYAEDECENVNTATQIIHVVDLTAPMLSDLPADLVLDCGDEVPEPPVITAADLCDGDVEVIFSESFEGDFPDPEAEHDCQLIQPVSPFYNPDWAVWLQGLTPAYQYYTLIDGSWKDYDDGTAHIEATVVSASNANAGWIVDVWLMNGMDWASWSTQGFPTSYKDDFNEAGDNYLDWIYYIMNNNAATLVGWGDLEGSTLELSHAPSGMYYGYQLGVAANNVNTEYGSGGWFTYEGWLDNAGTGFEGNVTGAGDLAFDHDCCPQYEVVWTWSAEDCAGNSVSHTMTVSFDGDPAPVIDDFNEPASCPGDFNGDGHRNTADLLIMLSEYGCIHNDCGCDLTGDLDTNTADLLVMLSVFGLECAD